MLMADYREDAALTRVRAFDDGSVHDLRAELQTLAAQATGDLHEYGFEAAALDLLHRVDMRYLGQEHTITVPLDTSWLEDEAQLLAGCRQRFVALHNQVYGHGAADAPLEIVTRRCRAAGRVARPAWQELQPAAAAAPLSFRPVYFRQAGGFVDTAIYDRETLALGQMLEGPAIIQEWTSTTLVPPGWSASVDRLGNIVLELAGTGARGQA
jgi:N-methylhydantoinase A